MDVTTAKQHTIKYNVTHTYVWGMPNEKVVSIVASVVEIIIDASKGIEGLLHGCNNCKTTYNKILI
jgi:hypothetical protein